MYFFLQEDFDALEQRIKEAQKRRLDVGKEIGASCKEGAETFHDNFGFEESSRQFGMLEKQLLDLRRLRNAAQIFTPEPSDRVQVGSFVTIEDELGETLTFRIGSYMVLTDPDAISYRSPVARILLGGKEGEKRVGTINGKKREYTIKRVE